MIIMPIFINRYNIYLLQNNTNQSFLANNYMYKQFNISFKIILNKRFLVFKTQGFYCHE